MKGKAVVLRRNAGLRPQKVAYHPIAPCDARRLLRKRNRLVGECRRQAQTAPPHGRHKQRIHFRLLGRSRFRVDELNSDARFPQAFHALDAVNERGESGRRCKLRPHERARTIRLKGVASAKLISQSNELAHREGFGQLDKHKFRRAYGHAGSDFEKGPTQQRRSKLMEANTLRGMTPDFGPRENVKRALDRGVAP